MTRRHGHGLIAALAAIVALVSAAVYVGFGLAGGDGARAPLRPGPHTPPPGSADPASADAWVGTWSAPPSGAEPDSAAGYPDTSIRNVVHTSIGGTSARVTLSNLYGQRPLTLTHASIAVAAAPDGPAAVPGTLRRLTFGGERSVVIQPGRQVHSDEARLRVPADADLLVSVYAPTPAGPVTYHRHARQISYLAPGDHVADAPGGSYTEQSRHWRYLTAVDVRTPDADGAVAVIGDSLTDGITSTVGANARWTDVLADRLRDEPGAPRYAVLNQGISGNRILTDGPGTPADNPSGLSRFDRDVLGRSGVKAVVVALGVNDVLRSPRRADPAEITEGLRELTRRAHTRGLRVVGATLMPFGGHRGHTPRLEAVRAAINAEIRAGRVFDAYVDFDRALRDRYDPRRLRAVYDSGDHLHPSDAGYRRMGRALDPALLRGTAPAEL
ncbi:SGNH/GDSL hydrolase family protein [Streptomyces sp. O3]